MFCLTALAAKVLLKMWRVSSVPVPPVRLTDSDPARFHRISAMHPFCHLEPVQGIAPMIRVTQYYSLAFFPKRNPTLLLPFVVNYANH